jgi:hypothetical protein
MKSYAVMLDVMVPCPHYYSILIRISRVTAPETSSSADFIMVG